MAAFASKHVKIEFVQPSATFSKLPPTIWLQAWSRVWNLVSKQVDLVPGLRLSCWVAVLVTRQKVS